MTLATQGDQQRRGFSLGVSLLLHAIAFLALVNAPDIQLPRAGDSEYKQKIEGHEEKIVWFKFRNVMPNVTPLRANADRRPLRAQAKARQSIVSAPKQAPQRKQMVWTPAPEIAAKPLESANLVAVKLPPPPPKTFIAPESAPPPAVEQPRLATAAPQFAAQPIPPAEAPPVRLPPKAFIAPEIAPRPAAVQARVTTDAPQLAAQTASLIRVPSVRLPPKPFVAPDRAPAVTTAQTKLAVDAPQLAAQTASAAQLPSMRLPPKGYVAPPAAPRVPTRGVALAEAPQLVTSLNPLTAGSPVPAPKLPARPFTTPTSPGARPAATGAALEAPPNLELPANSKDLNAAIVGLNPIDKLRPMPQASSPAAFSSGPVPRRDGATAEGSGKGLTVPDLFVRAPRDLKSEMLAQAYAAPTSSETLRAVINRSQADQPPRIIAAPGNGAPDSGAAKVSTAPDPRFNGRDVYLMAIQMPNLTSYSGSWLMWYADRTLRQAGLAPISPPVAHRKVDPKYIASAVAERIEGRVTLGCVIDREGKVSRVELIHGIDDRLNRSAEEALSKWEFYPATRKGAPVDVDVVVEIPFRLEPRIPRR